MFRVLLLFLALMAVAAAGAWLADYPGNLTIDWQGYRIETSVAIAAVALFLILTVVAALYRFWRFLLHGPAALSGMRAGSRHRRGLEALNRGLIAVAVGDAAEAERQARRSEQLLDDPGLTQLLTAQAAQLSGDDSKARTQFEAMRADADMELLGLRGLLAEALRAGNRSEALTLARRAYELKPSARWAAEELFLLEVQAGNWQAARHIAERAGKDRIIDTDEAKRRTAIVQLAEARDAEAAGESHQALDLARRAHEAVPGLVPATLMAARLHAASGARRKARKLLEDGWRHENHRDILRAYLELEGGGDAASRVAALRRLTGRETVTDEAGVVLAEFALKEDDYNEADRRLRTVVHRGADRQVCLLMAALLEEGRADPAGARVWLRRASTAPLEPAWLCTTCAHASVEWFAVCPGCGRFGTAEWRHPPMPAALPAATEPARIAAPPGNAKTGPGDAERQPDVRQEEGREVDGRAAGAGEV